jgi:hypothetical protein
MPQLCVKCVLSDQFPGIQFDASGVCQFCRDAEHQTKQEQAFHDLERERLDRLLSELKGRYEYDALCCYSGGKDSTYILIEMVKSYGLKVLAYTLDNGHLAARAKSNIETIVDNLGVDHIFWRPAARFMSTMYRAAMSGELNAARKNYQTRISDACLACISLVNTVAVNIAIRREIPFIFTGFTPGQVPRAIIENPQHFYQASYEQSRANLQASLGVADARRFAIEKSDFTLYQVSPYLIRHRSEAEILREILAIGWASPEGLDGCSSNCELNGVGNRCHELRYGFHPYADELSKLIRKGLLARDEAIKKLQQSVSPAVFERVATRLHLSADEKARIGPR